MAVIEQPIEIRSADGTIDGFLYTRDDGKPRPGVIHLQDIMGIREPVRGMAKRLAESGYTVLLPNEFYRTGRPPLFDFPLEFGSERTMKRFGELTSPLTPEAQERDADAYVNYLASLPSVSKGKIGVVGYCFSGAVAMRMAAARSDKIGAAASFHGGGLYSDAPTSPHRLLPRIKSQLYFGHAVQDRSMTEEQIKNLESELRRWGGKFGSDTYQGALHGWTVP
ncbi:MAG TPA: dienelactone hydrolase family protein, partial [Alphaproteobacteria bacterium]|nr:dienelactone hydrolase family protein [Alphaproteobacteria bacterium]